MYIDAIGNITYTVSVIVSLQVMVYLLEHGADPNALDMTTRSCLLHWACQKGCLEAVKILVNFKADVNMRVSQIHVRTIRQLFCLQVLNLAFLNNSRFGITNFNVFQTYSVLLKPKRYMLLCC